MDRGTYRATNAVLLDDGDFQELPADARHLFHVLKITRLNNLAGIFICDAGAIVTLATQTGLSQKRIRDSIAVLSRYRWVYFEPPVLWVRNQLRFDPHINENNSNHIQAVEKILAGLPGSSIVAKFCNYYKIPIPTSVPKRYHSDTIGNGIQDGIGDTARDTIGDQDTDSDSDPDTDPKKKNPPIPPLGGEGAPADPIPFQAIVDDLNQVTGRHDPRKQFRNVEGVRKNIRGRWAEGFRLEDFQYVHRVKQAEWGNDLKMRKYVQPSTLYRRSHFADYRAQDMPNGVLERMSDTERQNAAAALRVLAGEEQPQ